ncbi:hypothetical protein [Bdellovibrio sp. HCB-162]|uniref:hypothetical protein n=1 Tax=Bdellovibrio sp. HCB-162 TaxID=3394234 RepID=UPI0039BCFA18
MLSILALSLTGFSFDAEKLQLALLCKQSQNCATKSKELVDRLTLSCEMEVQSQNCAELAHAHPDWAPLMRKCDFQGLCKQQNEYAEKAGMACLRGYKNAMIDLGISLKDMSVSLAGFVDDTWEKFKASNKRRNEFIAECDKSLACKRDLVKEDRRYRDLSDEKLNKLSAAFLYVQAQDMKAYMSSLERARPKPYVPISERPLREDVTLSAEQNDKLVRLLAMVSDQVKEQYHRYACYTPAAQEELKCYALGNIVDPTMMAGYFVKGGRAAAAVARLAHEEKALAVAEKIPLLRFSNRGELVKNYLEFSPTTVAQNEKWISLADKGVSSKNLFFDVENSQIKKLNDTLKDKNLVTSLTNFHKDILDKKMSSLQKDFPELVIDKYSDFKSMRFAFGGKIPPDLEKRLQKIFTETNEEFSSYLKDSRILREGDRAQDWFRAGVGSSADQANLAARYARGAPTNDMYSFARKDLQVAMGMKLNAIESDRMLLRQAFKDTSVLEGATLNQDAFDIVRKNSGDSKKISEALSNRFGLQSLSEKNVQTLERYVKSTDEFSPGLYIAKRENAHLNDAALGGLSADIIGLGGANLKGTAEALVQTTSINSALEKTRLSEKAVTKEFIEQKKAFETVVGRSVDPGKLKTICSGDDCVSVATAPLSEKDKTKILSGLANSKYSGSFRVAFVSDGVKEVESRNILANQGEAVEKKLRKALSSKMESHRLKGLTFGVDMRTQELNRGGVKLLMGEAESLRLTTRERELIRKSFQDALDSLNHELSQSGTRVQYTPVY